MPSYPLSLSLFQPADIKLVDLQHNLHHAFGFLYLNPYFDAARLSSPRQNCTRFAGIAV